MNTVCWARERIFGKFAVALIKLAIILNEFKGFSRKRASVFGRFRMIAILLGMIARLLGRVFSKLGTIQKELGMISNRLGMIQSPLGSILNLHKIFADGQGIILSKFEKVQGGKIIRIKEKNYGKHDNFTTGK